MARDIKKIDAKGRFFIPSKMKNKFEGDLIATRSLDAGYLCVYTAEHFSFIEDQFREMDSYDNAVRELSRLILGDAVDVAADSQGRLSFTSELWDIIGAKPGDEIYVTSILDKLEICTKDFHDNKPVDLKALTGSGGGISIKGL